MFTEKQIKRFWDKVEVKSDTECWPWLNFKNKKGYGQYRIAGTTYHTHRISFYVKNGYMPSSDRVVMHSCDSPSCCNPYHLSEGSHKDNADDRDEKGRGIKGKVNWQNGEDNHQAILTWDVVREIRYKFYRLGQTNKAQLAREYNISRPLATMIINNQRWKE